MSLLLSKPSTNAIATRQSVASSAHHVRGSTNVKCSNYNRAAMGSRGTQVFHGRSQYSLIDHERLMSWGPSKDVGRCAIYPQGRESMERHLSSPVRSVLIEYSGFHANPD